MQMNFVRKEDIGRLFEAGSWQRVLYSELEAVLVAEAQPVPCIYGVTGFRTSNLRFAFLDTLEASALAPILSAYLAEARDHGCHASLVVFERPRTVASMEVYRTRFWSLLNDLSSMNSAQWPELVPTEIDDPNWEFCFAGEPIFVVCNTPAHIMRQSRRSTGFMVAFQPRWVLEGIANMAFHPRIRRRGRN